MKTLLLFLIVAFASASVFQEAQSPQAPFMLFEEAAAELAKKETTAPVVPDEDDQTKMGVEALLLAVKAVERGDYRHTRSLSKRPRLPEVDLPKGGKRKPPVIQAVEDETSTDSSSSEASFKNKRGKSKATRSKSVEELLKEPDMFIVNKIKASRKRGKRFEYLIGWHGYDTEDDTWEPLENLETCMGMVEQYHLEHPNKASPFKK